MCFQIQGSVGVRQTTATAINLKTDLSTHMRMYSTVIVTIKEFSSVNFCLLLLFYTIGE